MSHNSSSSRLVKILGPSGTGTSTWWAQRVSAIALVPLVIWFILFVLQAYKQKDLDAFMSFFISPFPTLCFLLFITVAIYHGNIGIKEILEDYVHCHSIKIILIILVNFISLLSALAVICALLVFHLSTIGFN
jgi:succinate dehydrogenase / fumarate reductase, membrane anchor subunit